MILTTLTRDGAILAEPCCESSQDAGIVQEAPRTAVDNAPIGSNKECDLQEMTVLRFSPSRFFRIQPHGHNRLVSANRRNNCGCQP
jgi:hypothetical protein